MTIHDYLRAYAEQSQSFLDTFWSDRRHHVSRFESPSLGMPIAEKMVDMYEAYFGGKRLRGALVQLGYECGDGDGKEILAASLAMEVIHHFLLIHDDVMDQDALRHGQTTVHEQFKQFATEWGRPGAEHYGLSMAMTLGDIGAFWGMELMTQLSLPEDRVIAGIRHLSRFLVETGYGQALDVSLEHVYPVTEGEISQLHLYKTAQYTITGPLQLGGILVGLGEEQLAAMKLYGDAVGIAFQLRDDELGLYGDADRLGKPVGSDVRAGKNTLLRVKAMELASQVDQKFLEKCYGNDEVTRKEIEQVRMITRDCGALDYSRELAERLIIESKQVLLRLNLTEEKVRKVLESLADYMVKRED